MSRCVNSVILLGNCGNAPEIRYTASGKVLAKLSLAVNESFKNSHGEWQERTHWVSIVAWQRLAEIVGEYVLRAPGFMFRAALTLSRGTTEGAGRSAIACRLWLRG
jgi:single-strand DNA-binding protein